MIRRLISKNTHSLCLVLTLLAVTSRAVIAGGDTTADRQSTFAEQLEQLAIKCDELGLDHQAKVTRDWIVPLRTDQQVFYPFQNVDHERPPANAPQLEKFWYDRFAEIREQEAERLFKQALEPLMILPQPIDCCTRYFMKTTVTSKLVKSLAILTRRSCNYALSRSELKRRCH